MQKKANVQERAIATQRTLTNMVIKTDKVEWWNKITNK